MERSSDGNSGALYYPEHLLGRCLCLACSPCTLAEDLQENFTPCLPSGVTKKLCLMGWPTTAHPREDEPVPDGLCNTFACGTIHLTVY